MRIVNDSTKVHELNLNCLFSTQMILSLKLTTTQGLRQRGGRGALAPHFFPNNAFMEFI